jgi:hypothetical protein
MNGKAAGTPKLQGKGIETPALDGWKPMVYVLRQ